MAYRTMEAARAAYDKVKASMAITDTNYEATEIVDDFGTICLVSPSAISAVRLQPVKGGRELQINGQLESARINQLAQEEGQRDFGKGNPVVSPVAAALIDPRTGQPITPNSNRDARRAAEAVNRKN